VPNLECQWPNFALVTVICQGLYNFWLLPYFWSGFLMSKFGFSYVYPKCFWMRFQWYKFQVLIINDSKVKESFRGPVYRLHWGCSYCVMCEVVGVCYASAKAHGELTHTLVLLGDGWGNINKYLPLFGSLLIRNWFEAD
jgi:hypothetical protein